MSTGTGDSHVEDILVRAQEAREACASRVRSLHAQADILRVQASGVNSQMIGKPIKADYVAAIAQLEVAAALNEIAAALLAGGPPPYTKY